MVAGGGLGVPGKQAWPSLDNSQVSVVQVSEGPGAPCQNMMELGKTALFLV